MQLIRHFMADDARRAALNALTRQTFGFDFEKWYAAGYWEGDYLPYAFEENGRLIANVSVNRMRFLLDGQERCFVQLGTVMTDPAYRGRGLASALMREAMADAAGSCEGVYLFGDLGALPFYDKLGFHRALQYRYTLRPGVLGAPPAPESCFAPVDPADPAVRARYAQAVRGAAPCAALEHLNRFSLTMFYTAGMKRVHYCADLDFFAVLAREDDTLVVQGVFGAQRVPLRDVLARIITDAPTLRLGFAPLPQDAGLFDARPYDGGDDYRLFTLGGALDAIPAQKLYFPELSHA